MKQEEAITITQQVLRDHANKWQDRFAEYLEKTEKHIEAIKERRKKFHKWANLNVYYTIGRAKSNSHFFDLRYQGQSVGQISVSEEGNVLLHIDETQYKNNCNQNYLIGYPKDICRPTNRQKGNETGEGYPWRTSVEAKAFRKYFGTNPGKEGHPEHKYENLLLNEMSLKDGKEKSFKNIQPITIKKDLYFQMPTPLTASGNTIKYSEGHGGIDILARRKEGNESTLTVFELKDEYENPEKVICQAIAYATFVVELCETKACKDFKKLCGLQKQELEKIYVSILMPDPDGVSEPKFKNKVLTVPGSKIKLVLHYTFFDKDTVKITRSSIWK
ncbi:MAG: hypothetical protein K5920_11915 [Bacteroidales bacterium]|nr:hypothetical protein [Bacteroidales bacterium]